MKLAIRFLTAATLLLMVSGCAEDSQQQTNSNASSIPWNRPLPGEGQGPMGGLNPGPQGSTGH